MRLPLIERYRAFLPVSLNTPVVSLLEGSTPLIPLKGPEEARRQGIRLYAKYEGLNPTGSFKDRGMTLAVSKAVAEGAKAVACASTGNTAASAAAYAARAGVLSIVLLPAGYVAVGKVAQSLIHGARIVQVEGNFDDALRLTQKLTERFPVALVNSLNPYRLQGQKTLAFEVVDELGDAPHYHALPVGNAGNITAHWMGYKEYFALGKAKRLPRMLGFQAAGAAPLVLGHPVERPETIATAIRIGNPASWEGAIRAKEESGGLIEAVSDEEILAAYRYLAQEEGIFVEPASAASLAGVWRLLREERLEGGSAVERVARLPSPVPATLEAVAQASGLL